MHAVADGEHAFLSHGDLRRNDAVDLLRSEKDAAAAAGDGDDDRRCSVGLWPAFRPPGRRHYTARVAVLVEQSLPVVLFEILTTRVALPPARAAQLRCELARFHLFIS